jgi:hypothetical protein
MDKCNHKLSGTLSRIIILKDLYSKSPSPRREVSIFNKRKNMFVHHGIGIKHGYHTPPPPPGAKFIPPKKSYVKFKD